VCLLRRLHLRPLHGFTPTYAEFSRDKVRTKAALLALGVATNSERVQIAFKGAFTALHLIPACRVIDDLSQGSKTRKLKMKLPKLRTRGIACGSAVTALVTLLAAGDFLPAGWASVEAAAALSGLLATLAAAFGLCDQYEDRPMRDRSDEGTMQ